MTTNNHPAHGPVSLDRLHQIREILSRAASEYAEALREDAAQLRKGAAL